MRCIFCIPAASLAMQELQHPERPRVNDSGASAPPALARPRHPIVRELSADPPSGRQGTSITTANVGSLRHSNASNAFTNPNALERCGCVDTGVDAGRSLADARPAGALQTALHARIDLVPYQLEPALAVMRGRGSRVLIADDSRPGQDDSGGPDHRAS